MSQTLPGNTLLTENLRTKTEKSLEHLPCKWQVTVVEAILKKDKDVILIAAMGSGKTLTFGTIVLDASASCSRWYHDCLHATQSSWHAERCQSCQTWNSCHLYYSRDCHACKLQSEYSYDLAASRYTHMTHQDIANLKYRAIMTNIKSLMKPGGGFEGLWKNNIFTSRLITLTFDEGHCIGKRGMFCPEYQQVERL
jgi:hypothetical protein